MYDRRDSPYCIPEYQHGQSFLAFCGCVKAANRSIKSTSFGCHHQSCPGRAVFGSSISPTQMPMSTKPRILAQTSLLVIFSLCFSFEFSRKLDKRLVANILWFAVWKPFFPSRPLFLYLARTTTGPEHIHRRSRYSPFLGDQLTPATGLVAAQQSYQSNIEVAGSTLGALYRHDTLAVHGGKRCQNLREV